MVSIRSWKLYTSPLFLSTSTNSQRASSPVSAFCSRRGMSDVRFNVSQWKTRMKLNVTCFQVKLIHGGCQWKWNKNQTFFSLRCFHVEDLKFIWTFTETFSIFLVYYYYIAVFFITLCILFVKIRKAVILDLVKVQHPSYWRLIYDN